MRRSTSINLIRQICGDGVSAEHKLVFIVILSHFDVMPDMTSQFISERSSIILEKVEILLDDLTKAGYLSVLTVQKRSKIYRHYSISSASLIRAQ